MNTSYNNKLKVKLYIVTYKGHDRLGPTLSSLLNSDLSDHSHEINLINNHTDLRVPPEFASKVKILHNVLRPDCSSGHLSRNWNQALINGFGSLLDPDCDIVVCSQDDSIFRQDWLERLLLLHKRFTFVQNGHGDQFHSYLPEAVRRIGLWDERFCGISMQAADYFWRCVMHNKEGSTIQDPIHHRVLNPIIVDDVIASQGHLVDPDVRQFGQNWDNSLHNNDSIASKLMRSKYANDPYPWTPDKINSAPSRALGPNYLTYPYFEKDIYNLKEKGYMI